MDGKRKMEKRKMEKRKMEKRKRKRRKRIGEIIQIPIMQILVTMIKIREKRKKRMIQETLIPINTCNTYVNG